MHNSPEIEEMLARIDHQVAMSGLPSGNEVTRAAADSTLKGTVQRHDFGSTTTETATAREDWGGIAFGNVRASAQTANAQPVGQTNVRGLHLESSVPEEAGGAIDEDGLWADTLETQELMQGTEGTREFETGDTAPHEGSAANLAPGRLDFPHALAPSQSTHDDYTGEAIEGMWAAALPIARAISVGNVLGKAAGAIGGNNSGSNQGTEGSLGY